MAKTVAEQEYPGPWINPPKTVEIIRENLPLKTFLRSRLKAFQSKAKFLLASTVARLKK